MSTAQLKSVTYIVTIKCQVNTADQYGKRVVSGRFGTAYAANEHARYVMGFGDSCVAIERTVA